jgi:hypothetical protein
MSDDRKPKREPEGPVEIETDNTSFLLEPAQIELGSGYTVKLTYDEHDKPIIDIKTYGQVDIPRIRREIERIYPRAQIRQLGQESATIIAKATKKKRKPRK